MIENVQNFIMISDLGYINVLITSHQRFCHVASTIQSRCINVSITSHQRFRNVIKSLDNIQEFDKNNTIIKKMIWI